MNRILVIRGGALGDFVLTLPAIKLLRDRFPEAHLEILGSPHILALAEKRFYADAIRSIDPAPFARFFANNTELPGELAAYFGSFDLILSYLFDPDGIFEANLRRCGIQEFISGTPRLDHREHAARQLARPLEALRLYLGSTAAKIFPTAADRESARDFLGDPSRRLIAFHPGSGSETKNWPITHWQELGSRLLEMGHELLVISGEADEQRARSLAEAWKGQAVQFARNLPLPLLAAILENRSFVGHDSGISHIAAAVGARCVLLFGWTDPAIWAPANENVTVLRSPDGKIEEIDIGTVLAAIRPASV